MFFYGQWDRYAIDEKGRVIVPTVFRKVLGKEVIVVESRPALLVYPRKPRFLKRFKPEKIWLLRTDSNSRLLLPEILRRSFQQREIVWLGKGDHLEIQIQKGSLRKSKMRA